MNIKLKTKSYFKYGYLVVFIVNILAIMLLYRFLNTKVIKIIYFDNSQLMDRVEVGGNLDIKKFNMVMNKYNERIHSSQNIKINNIF